MTGYAEHFLTVAVQNEKRATNCRRAARPRILPYEGAKIFDGHCNLGQLISPGTDEGARMLDPIIVADPEVLNGTPCFRGTRGPFKNLMDYLEGGHSMGEFLRQFPSVTQEMAVQALEEAKESLLARIA